MSKGKQPRTRVKVPKLSLSEIKDVFFKYNQEIGLEAAIFWRPRNRALIKEKNTENLTDLNDIPKPCTHMYNNKILSMWGSGTLDKYSLLFLFKTFFYI